MNVMKRCSPLVVAFFLWTALSASQARTQQPARETLLKPSDTSSPAATLSSLIDSCNELHKLIGDESNTVDSLRTMREWMLSSCRVSISRRST